MDRTMLFLVWIGLIATSAAGGRQGLQSYLPKDEHFPQFRTPYRDDKHGGSWMANRKSDDAQFIVRVNSAATLADALKLANDSVVAGSQRFRPDEKAVFATTSPITNRAVGDAYWIGESDVHRIVGSAKIVIRSGTLVYVGIVIECGTKPNGYADPRPIPQKDMKLLEDLILDGIHQAR
jgi:hypothetical protein